MNLETSVIYRKGAKSAKDAKKIKDLSAEGVFICPSGGLEKPHQFLFSVGDADLFPSPACGRGVRGEGFVFPIKNLGKSTAFPSPPPSPASGRGEKTRGVDEISVSLSRLKSTSEDYGADCQEEKSRQHVPA